ncbi:transposable element Tc1 transposase [Trichonephila clavipes]|nr:transposable element Tc1 transposase [Trichonephila clavipes]
MCTKVGFVNSSASVAPWIACKGAFIQDALMANHRRLRLHWAHEKRTWQAEWHQVVYSYESRFNLGDHDGHIRAGERCLPENVNERHSGLTPGVMVWGVIWYHGLSNLLRIERNLSSNRRFARDPRPATSKDELLMRIQAIWNSLPQTDIQNQFDTMPRRIAARIAEHGGCTEY